MQIKIVETTQGPSGKVADAEIHFTDGPLEGLKLIGFSIWEKRYGSCGHNVTFPARQYAVNGERRSFALLRPIVDVHSQEPIRDAILAALDSWQRYGRDVYTFGQDSHHQDEQPATPAGWATIDTSIEQPAAEQPATLVPFGSPQATATVARQLADVPAEQRPVALAASLTQPRPTAQPARPQPIARPPADDLDF